MDFILDSKRFPENVCQQIVTPYMLLTSCMTVSKGMFKSVLRALVRMPLPGVPSRDEYSKATRGRFKKLGKPVQGLDRTKLLKGCPVSARIATEEGFSDLLIGFRELHARLKSFFRGDVMVLKVFQRKDVALFAQLVRWSPTLDKILESEEGPQKTRPVYLSLCFESGARLSKRSLHEATWSVEQVSYLLEHQHANPNQSGLFGRTPLHEAMSKEKGSKVAKILILYGAKVDYRDSLGNLPAHFAAYREGTRLLKLFLDEYKIDIHARTMTGETFLHIAARWGNRSMVEMLVRRKADWRLVDNQFRLPADVARENGHFEIAHMLQAK